MNYQIIKLTNAYLMLGQRRRRWTNIKSALGERLVSALRGPHLGLCLIRVYRVSLKYYDAIYSPFKIISAMIAARCDPLDKHSSSLNLIFIPIIA